MGKPARHQRNALGLGYLFAVRIAQQEVHRRIFDVLVQVNKVFGGKGFAFFFLAVFLEQGRGELDKSLAGRAREDVAGRHAQFQAEAGQAQHRIRVAVHGHFFAVVVGVGVQHEIQQTAAFFFQGGVHLPTVEVGQGHDEGVCIGQADAAAAGRSPQHTCA